MGYIDSGVVHRIHRVIGDAALIVCERADDVPHLTLRAQDVERDGVLAGFAAAGVADADAILHVHVFPDHSLDKSLQAHGARGRDEFLHRWSGALARSAHGLIMLEAHGPPVVESLTPDEPAVREAPPGCGAADAEAFLISAASAGLFARSPPRHYPAAPSPCRATLIQLEARSYRVRRARADDVPALVTLEERCWAEELRMPEAVVRRRLGVCPTGQLVVEISDPAGGARVVGAIYSQRIAATEDIRGIDCENASAIHTADGPIVQLLSINVDPAYQERHLGDQLLELMLQRCAATSGVRAVVAVSLCRDFHKQTAMTMAAYVGHRNELGQLSDPILRFHERHGARIAGLVPGYRPNDANNQGSGVLVSYDIHRRSRREVEVGERAAHGGRGLAGPSEPAPAPPGVDGMPEFLERTIQRIVGSERAVVYSRELPLMDLGLDSVGMLELADRIAVRCRRRLEPSFLFQYNTPRRIAEYFKPAPPELAPEGGSPEPREAVHLVRETDGDAIAIIGMACRLPGGIDTPDRLWRCLKDGRSVIGQVPAQRWTWPSGIDPVRAQPGIDRGGFLDDIARFDATLFRLSPKEVKTMDPQQRIVLELAWEALESCGYSADAIAGSKTGVFIGASGSDYRLVVEQAGAPIEPHLATGGSMAVLANRISYFFDLTGPSLQIDTACSSSLVAVHEAVQTLRAGRCAQALVGGVNIMCHPGSTVAYYKAGMLSKDGRCKTLDDAADGYVRSEGAVMLVLKPVQAALRDGDPIHAVIRGTACNHGGLAGGLTVPNPGRQAELLREAWSAAAVSPNSISYVELHGTGTKLGDPIELRGLTEAFATGGEPPVPESCALSSIKSNVGHLEAAAGIAGLLKVVLSLTHRELAPTIHFTRLNARIDLAPTPFYVVQHHRAWPELPGRGGLPRRAGVSSFGSGGTNAHVVVDEHVRPAQPAAPLPPRLLFVLSARTRERLIAYARRLIDQVTVWRDDGCLPALDSFVYSLQRRQALEDRVACVVGSFAELAQRLTELVDTARSPALYLGNVAEGRAVADFVNHNDEVKGVVQTWLAAGQLERVAKLWTNGVAVEDWRVLYPAPPARIALPGYPFAQDRYWIEPAPRARAAVGTSEPDRSPAPAPALTATAPPLPVAPPLIPAVTPSLPAVTPSLPAVTPSLPAVTPLIPAGTPFTVLLTGQEFFVTDHQVNGKHVLPGAAYLELVHEAIRRSVMAKASHDRPVDRLIEVSIELEDAVWARPITVDAPREVHVGLTPAAGGSEAAFEIYTQGAEPGSARLVHSTGVVTVVSGEPQRVDLPAIRDRLRRRPSGPHDGSIDPEAYYRSLHSVGLVYGAAHRGLAALHLGLDDQGARELLAHLVLPGCIADTEGRHALHPSLIDAAIQAALAVAATDERLAISQLALPFALKRLSYLRPCTRSMWAWVRPSPGPAPVAPLRSVDLDLCDEAGAVCVRMRGLSFRPVPVEDRTEGPRPRRDAVDTVVLTPAWRPAPHAGHAGAPDREAIDRHVVLCGSRDRAHAVQAALRERGRSRTSVVALASSDATLAGRFTDGALQVFALIQRVIRGKARARTALHVVVPGDGPDAVFAALAGMIRTASLEYPKLSGQLLIVSAQDSADALVDKIIENGAAEDRLVRHDGPTRFVADLQEATGAPPAPPLAWKEGGVYLITGGAGGLGLIFANEIASRLARVTIVLVGRSEPGESARAAIGGLARDGVRLEHRAVDVGDPAAVDALIRGIQRDHGGLNGVLHAAGVTRDGLLARKTEDDVAAVLRPKIAGTYHLYEATRALDLDFFVAFSSIVALTGNPGQADYCTANAFLDAVAQLHGASDAHRRGRVLSINWPLWRDGGMGQAADARTQLARQLGLVPMPTADGIAAFHRALASDQPQAIVVCGDAARIRAVMSGQASTEASLATLAPRREPDGAQAAAPGGTRAPATRDRVRDVEDYLRRVVGEVLGLPASRVGVDAGFSSYGMDSILAFELIRRLEADLGSLSKTLLFENESIGRLAHFLTDEYADKLTRLGVATNAAPAAPGPSLYAATPAPARCRIIAKRDLAGDAAIAALVARIRGTSRHDVALLEVWPELFVSEDGHGYCHILQHDQLVFATQYTGPVEHRATLLGALGAYCTSHGHELGYLDMSEGRKTDLEQSLGLVSLPVGVIQTIEDLPGFTLAGSRMKRLRYMVERFRKAGACRTVECRALDAAVSREIRDVIYAWCEAKKVVNNVDVVLGAMTSGTLLQRYRVFLTHAGAKLQNIIMILPIEGGYLMDQEYYRPEMPLGGTEFAVAEIIKVLASEGHRELSLGLTWGLFEANERYSDVAGDALLRTTRTPLTQILEAGAANHQYKAKYAPREFTVYLYRRRDGDERVIIKCLGQFFRKAITYHDVKQLLEPAAAPAGDAIPDEFYDVTRLDPAALRIDLVSDSWSHVGYRFIRERNEQLARRVQRARAPDEVVAELFGIPQFCLTTSGRAAERLWFQTYRQSHGQGRDQTVRTEHRTVLQNVLFESTLHNLVKAGFTAVEIPDRAAFERGAEVMFRGGIDLAELARRLDDRADGVAMVFLELCNNASGGYPVSLAQLRQIREAAAGHRVPLVIDVTRILRNAALIRAHEPGCGDRDLWSIVRDIAGCADAIVGSLCKDFGLSAGGIVAARDAAAIQAIRAFAQIEGGIPGSFDAALITEGLRDRDTLQASIARQLDTVRDVHAQLRAAGVPVVQPGAGHCVVVRVDELPGYAARKYPRESYLRLLAERYGIRGGIHLIGQQRDTPLDHSVRLALPLGLDDARLAPSVVGALRASLTGEPHEVPDLLDAASSVLAAPAIQYVAETEAEADIAIIGLSGRYPGAGTPDKLWSNLLSGQHYISEVPEDRWDWRLHYCADPEAAAVLGKSYGKWGGFLEGFHEFDPLFFRMSPREVQYIDPQERLFLMECWKALEDAGYPPSAFTAAVRQRIGVFGGVTKQGFNLYAAEHDPPYAHTSLASMVSRVSYCLDLKGPALAFDNHCASALVAIHEACEYLRHGKGDLAIAGAVNLNLHPANYAQLSKLQVLSRTDRSAAFARRGTGYVPGEGAGAVVLKGYRRAVQDGDPIYAVIRGSAINQNGRMNRFGLPSQKQIEAVIAAALHQRAIDPRTVNYIETSAHGSEAGDAIEMAALTSVFGSRDGASGSYTLGSVKPNLGHGEAVSGMAQLTKVLLSLQHGTLAPTRVPEELNPNIDFERLPFALQRSAGAWQPVVVDGRAVPRRAGITSTGASGVNAHIVVEEHVPERPPPAITAEPMVFVLSARDPERLTEYAARWIGFLRDDLERDLAPIVYTLQIGREAMAARLAIVTSGARDLAGKLARWRDGDRALDGEAVFHGTVAGEHAKRDGELGSGDPRALARRWVEGDPIAWPALYRAQRPRRVGGLPLYPFAREPYWTAHAPRVSRPAAPAVPAVRAASPAADAGAPAARFVDQLTALFAEVFGVPHSRLAADERLERYGINSYLIMVLNSKLATVFGQLSKTLLFEYQTIGDLARHLLSRHAAACAAWVGTGAPAAPALPVDAPVAPRAQAPDRAGVAEQPIAIIGLGARVAMARNVHELWDNLVRGRDCVGEVPADRWSLDGFYEPDPDQAIADRRCYSKWGGFLDGFSEFDPLFFNISPREAMNMDPQERIFLQACWEVLEDAAYTRERIASQHRGRLGVFAGVTRSEFCLYGPDVWSQGKIPYTSFCALVNRVSYFLDANGPSMPIDTMCSSSLVAVHEACEHLRRNECELAIAGGVNLSLHPYMYVSLSAQRMLSPDGRCKPFGKGANGYVPGEGVAAILLKPLSRALADRDRIHAVIRGTSVNHGGRTNGYTVPNPVAQGKVIRQALDRANVHARTVSYVEAHGTGTELGDPIEITGLSQAFQGDTADTGFCALGSVKSNIGHLEAASGIAGLAKVVLQMKHATLVPSLHAEELNPHIDFPGSPFVVNRALRPWDRPVVDGKVHPRIAGISSFGAGGSNAHVIVEEYATEDGADPAPVTAAGAAPAGPVLVVLSARKPEQLAAYAQRLLEMIREPAIRDGGRAGLAALAYTLQVGREAMDQRFGVIVESVPELEGKLVGFLAGEPIEDHVDAPAERTRLSAVRTRWLDGQRVDWRALHEAAPPPIVSAPTYPFARKTYWFETERPAAAGSQQGVEMSKQLEAPPEAAGLIRKLPDVATALASLPSAVRAKPSQIRLSALDAHLGPGAAPAALPPPIPARDVETLQVELAHRLASYLRVAPADIAPQASFVELGVDSLISAEWARELGERHGAAVTAETLLRHDNVIGLAQLLAGASGATAQRDARAAAPASAAPASAMPASAMPASAMPASAMPASAMPASAPAVTKVEVRASPERDQAADIAVAPSTPSAPVPMPVPAGPSKAKIQKELAASLAQALYMEVSDIDLEQPFMDMGLDSIIGVEWVHGVNRQYGIAIQVVQVYMYPSISQLAGLVEQELRRNAQTAPVPAPAVVEPSAPAPSFDDAPIADRAPRASESTIDTAHGTADAPAPPMTLLDELVDSLARAQFKQPAEIDVTKPLSDAGLDPIVEDDWLQRTSKKLGITIRAQDAHASRSIAELADRLARARNLGPDVETRREPTAEAKTELRAEPRTEPSAEPRTEPSAEPRTEPSAEPRTEPSAEPRPRPRPRIDASRAPAAERSSTTHEPIAIVGMSGRYPGARDLEEYWDNLAAAHSAIREVPASRWDVGRHYDQPGTPGKTYSKWLGALDDIDCFDAAFFGILAGRGRGDGPPAPDLPRGELQGLRADGIHDRCPR